MKYLPKIMGELHKHLQNILESQLGEILMRFGTILRGTCAYWRKCHVDLFELIKQIGCPKIFFTLSARDIQWPTLHKLMPGKSTIDTRKVKKWRHQNVIVILIL